MKTTLRVYVTSLLEYPNAVQTVHARFENGRHGKSFYNLSLHFLYCIHVFHNVWFFAHLPFENLQRFRIRLYFSHVILTNLHIVSLFCKMSVVCLQNVYIHFDNNCLQVYRLVTAMGSRSKLIGAPR